jgi:hypothetical protein
VNSASHQDSIFRTRLIHFISAIPAEKVTELVLLTDFSGKNVQKPVSESLAASGLAGLASFAVSGLAA